MISVEEIHKEFEKRLREFQKEVIPILQWNLSNHGYIYTGRLYSQMKISLTDLGQTSWELEFSMPTNNGVSYGRTLEKKETFAFQAPIKELTKWVEHVGLSKFRSIPGYENSNFVPADAAQRVAWAIKMSEKSYRQRRNPIYYSWFYRPFFGLWAEKREELVDLYFDQVPDRIVNELAHTYQQAVSGMVKHGKDRIR